jgi:hypothetical protein
MGCGTNLILLPIPQTSSTKSGIELANGLTKNMTADEAINAVMFLAEQEQWSAKELEEAVEEINRTGGYSAFNVSKNGTSAWAYGIVIGENHSKEMNELRFTRQPMFGDVVLFYQYLSTDYCSFYKTDCKIDKEKGAIIVANADGDRFMEVDYRKDLVVCPVKAIIAFVLTREEIEAHAG